mmetsp:Transcript_56701/g.116121  ORF Transcript_56701/g.116121 Transcript_56701/m.116121 type:complete len:256 (+) Transcript_56701:1633-2400(+)
MLLKVNLQNFKRHIIIVQLVVAECDVNIQGDGLSVLEKQSLVDICRFLIVVAQVVDGRQGQLILCIVGQFLVVDHQLVLVVQLVRQMKEQPILKSPSRSGEPRPSFQRSIIRLLVLTEIKQAARLVQIPNGFSLWLNNQLIKKLSSFLVVPQVKSTIRHPHNQRLRIFCTHRRLGISLKLKQSKRPRPITLAEKLIESWLLFLCPVLQSVCLCCLWRCAPWEHHPGLVSFLKCGLRANITGLKSTVTKRSRHFQM